MSKQKYPTTSVSTSTEGTKSGKRGRENYSHAKADARNNRRRDEADSRQAKFDALTLAEKLATLIKGGSKKQRAKLEKQLADQPAAPAKKAAKKKAAK